jgi:hypothetical protein
MPVGRRWLFGSEIKIPLTAYMYTEKSKKWQHFNKERTNVKKQNEEILIFSRLRNVRLWSNTQFLFSLLYRTEDKIWQCAETKNMTIT